MQIYENVPLKLHSTMRLGGTAAYAATCSSQEELTELLAWAEQKQLPVRVIGSGSNIVWRDEGFPGLLIVNGIKGFDVKAEADDVRVVTIGAGENWDDAVRRTVELGLTGIEALSLVPGTTGATPVQNVGAYGQDVSQTITSVKVYDTTDKSFKSISNDDCAFGYRTSRFKTTDSGRYIIVSVTFRLVKANPVPPFYRAVEDYFSAHTMTDFTPQTVRDAVIAIRSSKLPDPARVANNGSFFANPIVDQAILEIILEAYPDVPYWATETEGKVKIPAAWLIEHAGFKDVHDEVTGMATWHAQPLVLVNEHAKSTADLLAFKEKIVTRVRESFGISLEQEPELLP